MLLQLSAKLGKLEDELLFSLSSNLMVALAPDTLSENPITSPLPKCS